jgi:hypothetical protein
VHPIHQERDQRGVFPVFPTACRRKAFLHPAVKVFFALEVSFAAHFSPPNLPALCDLSAKIFL